MLVALSTGLTLLLRRIRRRPGVLGVRQIPDLGKLAGDRVRKTLLSLLGACRPDRITEQDDLPFALQELVLRLLADGVLTHPGYFFDFPRESFLILSLLPPTVSFDAGVSRILRHFDCKTAEQ